MINCPHCGVELFKAPDGLDKLSKQQAVIYRLFIDHPSRIWTVDAIARRMYAFDPGGGALNYATVVHIQIHRIRKRIGDVIETTSSGYRLRLSNSFAMVAEDATKGKV